MGPAELIYGALALAVGGGVGATLKALADSRAIRRKLGPEVENINITTLTSVIAGQDTLNENLAAFNLVLRNEKRRLEDRYRRLHVWALNVITHWHELRHCETPPKLPDGHDED